MQDGHRGQQSYILDGANTGIVSATLDDDFSTDTTGNYANADTDRGTISYDSNGFLRITYKGVNGSVLYKSSTLVSGKNYKVTFRAKGTHDAIMQSVGNNSDIGYAVSNPTLTTDWQDYEFYIAATQTTLRFYQSGTPDDGQTFDIDNILVQAINDKNHATTVFYGDELITATADKDMSGANNWADYNGGTESPTGGILQITVDGGGTSQGAQLSVGNLGTIAAGRTYRIQADLEFISGSDTDLAIQFALGNSATMIKALDGSPSDGTMTTPEETFYADVTTVDASGALRINCTSATNNSGGDNVFTADDVSVKEIGIATGWTDADQQLHIPQTALQSYNQLAWFDGVADYTSITDHDDFSFGDGTNDSEFSISAWIYMNDATTFPIVSKRSLSNEEWVFKADGSDKLKLQLYDQSAGGYKGRTYDTALTSYEGKWTHVVATYDGNEGDVEAGINLYINGEVVDDADSSSGSYTAMEEKDGAVTIGAELRYSNYANGAITEVSIWADNLTQAEVNELYNDGKALDATTHSAATNIKGYWRNNGLATWTNLNDSGTHDGTPTSLTETILIPAGVDATRDNQGFIMNRQKDTSSLNLYDTNGVTNDLTVNNYVSFPGNPITLTNDFCVSMWIKIHRYGVGMQSIISLADDDNNHFDFGMTTTRKLIGTIENSTGGMARFKQTSANADIAVDKWAHIVCCVSSGVSTGNNSATLIDSGATWPVDELIGGRVWDDTDNHGATITDNTDTVVTGVLSGGGDWDTDDKYTITKCYINTSNQTLDVAETTSAPDSTDVDNSYFIGTDNSSQKQFMGLIDNVLIYENKWLTSDEVTRIYNAGKGSHRN